MGLSAPVSEERYKFTNIVTKPSLFACLVTIECLIKGWCDSRSNSCSCATEFSYWDEQEFGSKCCSYIPIWNKKCVLCCRNTSVTSCVIFKWTISIVLHTIIKTGRVSQTQLVITLLLRSFIHVAYLRSDYMFFF